VDDDCRIPERDAYELTILFEKYSSKVFGYACFLTHGDEARADDLVQEAFHEAAKNWGAKLRYLPPDKQIAWLKTTARNKEATAYQRRKLLREKQPELLTLYQPRDADTEEQALTSVARRQAMEIIDGLPERQHRIARMYWINSMTGPEIAAELGIAAGTVHAQIHAARQKLITELEWYYDPLGKGQKGDAS
jgi:RNA polymerase sigma-70 factor, ECF subfamily